MSWKLFIVVLLLVEDDIWGPQIIEIKSHVIKIKMCPRYLYIKRRNYWKGSIPLLPCHPEQDW